MDARISKVICEWMMEYPDISHIIETHKFVETPGLSCPFRTGGGQIEYCQEVIDELTYIELKFYILAEFFRIILGHPYERKPEGCSDEAVSIASNMVLADKFDFSVISLPEPHSYGLKSGESYEYYAHAIEEMLNSEEENQEDESEPACISDGNGSKDSSTSEEDEEPAQASDGCKVISCDVNHGELCALWEEDEFEQFSLAISCQGNGLGFLSEGSGGTVKCGTAANLNYRRVLSAFLDRMQNSTPVLTRMRPNRRMGFERMGRKNTYKAFILIALDTSGSISTGELQVFLGSINQLFKYDVDKVDVISFDTMVSDLGTFKKAQTELPVPSRGGTDFVPVFEYYDKHPEYNGLIIFTDGFAPVPPPLKSKKQVVWVLTTGERAEELSKVGVCCVFKQ